MSTTARTYTTRAEWLAARRTLGIGSSDAPIILGLSKWKSPLALYYEKTGQVEAAEEETEWQRWGRVLEGPIAERYAEETGRRIVRPSAEYQFTIHQNREREWMIASVDALVAVATPTDKTPDYIANGPGVLEIKNTSQFLGDLWGEEPPVMYQVQLQHQLAVTGCKWGSIAALIGGNKFVYADLKRDDDFIAALVKAETEFIERVERREPPEADGSESTKALLKMLYPHDTGETVELPVELLDADAAREKGILLEKEGEALRADAENKLKAAIGAASVGVLRDGTVYTFKAQTRKEVVQAACTFRVLRRKGAK